MKEASLILVFSVKHKDVMMFLKEEMGGNPRPPPPGLFVVPTSLQLRLVYQSGASQIQGDLGELGK